MEEPPSCCFNCRWQVSCDKNTKHTIRHSTLYPGSVFIDSCEDYVPMYITERKLAELCGTTRRVIDYALSKGDEFAKETIKAKFGIEIGIYHDSPGVMKRKRIFLKDKKFIRIIGKENLSDEKEKNNGKLYRQCPTSEDRS